MTRQCPGGSNLAPASSVSGGCRPATTTTAGGSSITGASTSDDNTGTVAAGSGSGVGNGSTSRCPTGPITHNSGAQLMQPNGEQQQQRLEIRPQQQRRQRRQQQQHHQQQQQYGHHGHAWVVGGCAGDVPAHAGGDSQWWPAAGQQLMLAHPPAALSAEQQQYIQQYSQVGGPACTVYLPVMGMAPNGAMLLPCIATVGFMPPWQAADGQAGAGEEEDEDEDNDEEADEAEEQEEEQQQRRQQRRHWRHQRQHLQTSGRNGGSAASPAGSRPSSRASASSGRGDVRAAGQGRGGGRGGSGARIGGGRGGGVVSNARAGDSSASTSQAPPLRQRHSNSNAAASQAAAGAAAAAATSPLNSSSPPPGGGGDGASGGSGSGKLVSQPPGSENQSWAWLVEGILQQVVQHLVANSNLQAFRLTCRHWKAVCDHNIRSLAPTGLWPKDLVLLFPRLQVLDLTQCKNVRNRDLFVVAESRMQLRCLTIGDDAHKPWVTNKGLISIGRMTSLWALALHDCNSVTNRGLEELSKLVRLNSLSLRGCRKVTNNGLEVLQANTCLHSLNLHGCKRISDKGLAVLVHLPLRALSLGLTRVKDEGMEYLAKLTQLTELHCTNEELTDEGIHHLSCLTELNTLALRDCCEVSGDALLALLPSLPHLAHLNLFKNWEFGDEQLVKCCVHMLGLRSLDLRGTWVTHRGLAELSQLTSLTKLALAPHAELTPGQTGVVAALTQLRSLTLSCHTYSVALMEAVARLTRLKELNLSSMALPDAAASQPPLASHVLRAAASLTGLTSLDLSRRVAAPGRLRELVGGLRRLETLALHGCPLAAEDVAELEKAFPAVNLLKRNHTLDASPELATLLGTLSIT